MLLQDVLIEPALRYGKPVGWFAPIYKDLNENWRDVVHVLGPVIKSANSTDKRIELVTGGVIDMWSLDDRDSGRGRKYSRVVINEASKVKDLQYSWEYVIRATLADFGGDAWIGGTPKGFNYFATLCKAFEEREDGRHYHYTTYDNPHIPRNEIEELRLMLPDRVFRQEILAEFIEDGAFFQNVDQCAVIESPDTPDAHSGHSFVMGIDWAKSNDYTVIVVGCRECHRVVDWQRSNQIDYVFQRALVNEMARRWKIEGALPERNSIGEPNIEMLWRDDVPIMSGDDGKLGFATLPSTKPKLIEDLAAAFQFHDYRVPVAARDELRMYEINISKSGQSQFSAPAGLHDDWVMALALTWRAMTSIQPLQYF